MFNQFSHFQPAGCAPHAIDLRGRVLVGGCSSAHNLVLVHLGLAAQNMATQPEPHSPRPPRRDQRRSFPSP